MESERAKLERQIRCMEFVIREWGVVYDDHEDRDDVFADILAEKRAALAALDGPADGYVRRWGVIADVPMATEEAARATLRSQVFAAGHDGVIVVADLPIRTIPVVVGRVVGGES